MLREQMLGKRVQCPRCNGVFTAPEKGAATEPNLVSCPSCGSQLMVGANILGKRVKCPNCNGIFPAPEPPNETEPDQRITAQAPTKPPEVAPEETINVLPPPVPTRSGPKVDIDEDELDDVRQRKKKKRAQAAGRKRGAENASWPWWVFGGGGIAAVELSLLGLAVFLEPGHLLAPYAAYLFIMLPISTGIFFAAMYLSSIWFGALEIGEIHVAVVKAFILVAIVNVVSLLPWCGFVFTLLIWFAGILTLFRLDVWEARILILINWVLNLGLKFLLMMLFASAGTRP
jgi:predicted Zn finger-like uncharacterized protein